MPKIIIIGGGLSGLAVAFELLKKGCAIELFEKDSQLGGLAGSFNLNGAAIEKLYHHVFKNDLSVQKLLKELGLDEKIRWLNGSTAIYYEGKMHAFNTPLDLLKFKPLSIFNRLRLGVIMLFLQKTKNWRKFTDIPAYIWLKKYCGQKAYQVLWQPLLKGKFHDFYKDISMAWFWARIHTRGNSKEKGESKEKLGYLAGSLQTLIAALETECKKRGAIIHLNAELEKIDSKNKKIALADGKNFSYDKLICAIPSSELYKALGDDSGLPENYLNKLKSIKYLGVACAVFSSKQSLGDYYWYNINDPESPFLVMVQHTNLVNKDEYGGEHVYYLGSYLPVENNLFIKNEADILKDFFSYLKKIFPDFSEAGISSRQVFKYRSAQHIVDCAYSEKIPEYQIPGTDIYLLNFSQIFPEDRGINFAIKEAEKLSNKIL
jgi:protoporphyrinogen oxidase